ncbi:AAA family ATPase [Robertmurraya kyonggiensis]|uniref:Tunicamycin resistance protein n=1 Tax=Robertmurraya kyonggiensis TaxID=1037680 RepID=A0A4U1D8I2_9BACI|nr:AAA family ATPase [Robertmurraya kyonggiensis]TKC18822.1 tunicamycin resistance protein [Robertmurraya kyonggiensis]
MIIMLNGAFGVGKTTVAKELHNTMKDTMLYDPEEVGFMLRSIITEDIKFPEERTDNFQDLKLWKQLVVQVAEQLRYRYNKHLIVPMTIYNKDYYHYIYEGFKNIDKETYHFCLIAEESTIHERLRLRGEKEGNWCYQQTSMCVTAFQEAEFALRIKTDGKSIDEIANVKECEIDA